MLQHPSGDWSWARFVLVYPDGNPAWAPLAERYQSLLTTTSTFATATFDQLMAAHALDPHVQQALVERYRCWSE